MRRKAAKGHHIGNLVQIMVGLDVPTFKLLKRMAKDNDVSFSEQIRSVVRRGIEPGLRRVA